MPATTYYVSVPAALTKLLENSEQKPSEKSLILPNGYEGGSQACNQGVGIKRDQLALE